MNVTRITDNNVRYFSDVIGNYYRNRTPEDLFAGVIDDEGRAVATGVFKEKGDHLIIRFLYVDESARRRGYGSALLDAVIEASENTSLISVFSYLFLSEDKDDDDGLLDFFKSYGFEIQKDESRRSVYAFSDIRSNINYKNTQKLSDAIVKSPKELMFFERDALLSEFDAGDVLSPNNTYGGVLFMHNRVRGAIAARPFADGVKISSLYSDGNAPVNLCMLFEHVLMMIEDSGMDVKKVYVDTAGENRMAFEDKYMQHYGIKPIETKNAFVAVWEVE